MAGVQFQFLAETKGFNGVRLYLQEHRQLAPNVLYELSLPILLDDGDGLDRSSQSEDAFGICMELLSVRVQRDIWSALASGASPSQQAAEDLARAFLRVASRRRRESDAVCVSLARMLLRGDADESEESTDEAFRRRMRRFTLSRVKFPSQEDEDKRVATTGMQKATASSNGGKLVRAGVITSQWNKRPRSDVPEDQEMIEEPPRSYTPVATEADVGTPEPPPLTKEVEDSAAVLAKQLVQLTRSEATAAVDDVAKRAFIMLAEVVNDVHTTYAANERSFQYLCKMLRMECTSDEALSLITSALVDSNWSSRYAAIFLETSVLPKIRSADSVISRVLLQTALRFGSTYAVTLVDSLILPLLVGDEKEESNGHFGPPQAEAITRILRSPDTVPTDQLDGFIQKSLEAMTVNANANLLSNESVLLVFQNILNTKPVLSLLTIEKFVGGCEAVLECPDTEQVRGSLRFATVVFSLISKYPEQCARHVETLEAIANQLTSIMAKTTLRSLRKLKANK